MNFPILASSVLVLVTSGCVLKANHDEVVAKSLKCDAELQGTIKERDQLRTKLEDAQKRLGDVETRNDELSQTNQMLAGKNSEFSKRSIDSQKELLRVKKEEDDRAQKEAVYTKQLTDDFSKTFRAELEQGFLTMSARIDELAIGLSDRIIFTNTGDQLQPAAKKLLSKLSDFFQKAKGRDVIVEASVEGAPASKALRTHYPSAWEFSSLRATRIARYLVETGTEVSRLSATGNGPQTRRTEIHVRSLSSPSRP